MSTTASYELQKAIWGRLNGNTTYPYYIEVPENASYPFCHLNSILEVSENAKFCEGSRLEVIFDIWDSLGDIGGSDKRITVIADEIKNLFTTSYNTVQNFFTLTSLSVIKQEFVSLNLVPGNAIDQAIRHGVLTFSFLVQAK